MIMMLLFWSQWILVFFKKHIYLIVILGAHFGAVTGQARRACLLNRAIL